MKDYLIKTFDGIEEWRSKCIRQGGLFYRLNIDIIKVSYYDGYKWLLKGDENLIYNVDIKRYMHRGNLSNTYIFNTIDGLHGSNKFDCNLAHCNPQEGHKLCTQDYAEANLTLDKATGIYYKKLKPSIYDNIFYENVKYGYADSKSLFDKHKEKVFPSFLNDLNPKYSFGVELETSSGIVPVNDLLKNGVLPVKDGSTNNFEYVTKPLTQIESLLPIIESVQKNCDFDITTSLHIHLGNVPTDKEFILTFYKFMVNMQPAIFKMFPKYKADNHLKIKRKNYTQMLKRFLKFESILNFLNNEKQCNVEYTGKRLDHSADRQRRNKWYILSRYYWVNLIPLIFYPSRTIEFRIHQGTFNKYKIIYWLLICIAMVKYVEDTNEFKGITIKKLLEHSYPNKRVSTALLQHYNDMVEYYINYNEEEDREYRLDVMDDYKYIPKIKLF